MRPAFFAWILLLRGNIQLQGTIAQILRALSQVAAVAVDIVFIAGI
jgi:hypothetical protein